MLIVYDKHNHTCSIYINMCSGLFFADDFALFVVHENEEIENGSAAV